MHHVKETAFNESFGTGSWVFNSRGWGPGFNIQGHGHWAEKRFTAGAYSNFNSYTLVWKCISSLSPTHSWAIIISLNKDHISLHKLERFCFYKPVLKWVLVGAEKILKCDRANTILMAPNGSEQNSYTPHGKYLLMSMGNKENTTSHLNLWSMGTKPGLVKLIPPSPSKPPTGV